MKSVLLEMEKLNNLNSGLGQFCLQLGNEFAVADLTGIELSFYLHSKQRNIFGDRFNYINCSVIHKFLPPALNVDIWHCLHQGSKFMPHTNKTKLILTIHDLNFLHKYSGVKRKWYLQQLQRKVNKSSAITFISKYTEGIAREFLALPAVPTKVIYNGNTLQHFPVDERPAFVPNGKFIFTIGIISEKKNFHVLLGFLKEMKDLTLIIAGNNTSDYTRRIKELAHTLHIEDRLIMPGIVSDREKLWLYMNCEAFVFPSLAEGFGLPVIEAMSCGKPVFLSTYTSLPEIAGDAGYYWNSFDSIEMKSVYEKGMAEHQSDPSHVQKCMLRSAQFTWKKSVDDYLALYRSL